MSLAAQALAKLESDALAGDLDAYAAILNWSHEDPGTYDAAVAELMQEREGIIDPSQFIV